MRLLDETLLSERKCYDTLSKLAETIEEKLQELESRREEDTYNNQYVVRVTVDRIDNA